MCIYICFYIFSFIINTLLLNNCTKLHFSDREYYNWFVAHCVLILIGKNKYNIIHSQIN